MYLSEILSDNDLTDAQIDRLLFSKDCEKPVLSDYAIVLGTAPEYALFRADIAASFYKKGGAEMIVVSGAEVYDKSVTECSILKEELLKRGVPSDAIVEEPHAYDTIQNMTCSLTEICKRTDIMSVKSITVITEPFHIRRSVCLAKILLPQFINIYGYSEGVDRQRTEWKNDERLNNCVKNEIAILRQLYEKGRIGDIEI